MKLAEALILRADCQKRINQLRDRLVRSAKVQEGEAPPENPSALLTELEATVAQLSDLIQRINKTNAMTALEETATIADVLAQRDTLLIKRGAYDALVNAAAYSPARYSNAEIKTISTVNVAELQAQTDQISRQIRQLDTQIQAANWIVDLIE